MEVTSWALLWSLQQKNRLHHFSQLATLKGKKNFLMAFKKKTWLKSFIDFFVIGGSYYVQSSVKPKILAFTPKGIYLMDIGDVTENHSNHVEEMPWNQVQDFTYKTVLNTVRLNWNYQNEAIYFPWMSVRLVSMWVSINLTRAL